MGSPDEPTDAGPPNARPSAARTPRDAVTDLGPDARVELKISAENMLVTVSLGPTASPEGLTVTALRALAESRGVLPDLFDESAAAALIHDFVTRPRDLSAVVARGTPPVTGESGRFEIDPGLGEAIERAKALRRVLAERAADPNAEPPPIPPDDESPADHRARSPYVVVAVGTALGRMVPPASGIDGRDVFGLAVAAKHGRPAHLALEGAATQPDGTVLASRSGELRVTPAVVTVDPVLRIAGSVGFETGHVDFPGDVAVRGNVADCFRVRAGGGIVVNGTAEACTIQCELHAVLAGGMAGRARGTITVGGDLDARYLNSCTATVQGDCRIDREIYEANLRCAGALAAPRCVARSGNLRAARGIDVAVLGGEAGEAMEITVGLLDDVQDLLTDGAQLLDQLRDRVRRDEHAISQIKANVGRLTARQAEELTDLEFRLDASTKRLERLTAAVDAARASIAQRSAAVVVVREVLHPGVVVHLGSWRLDFFERLEGHHRLTLEAGRPHLLSVTRDQSLRLDDFARAGSTAAKPAKAA